MKFSKFRRRMCHVWQFTRRNLAFKSRFMVVLECTELTSFFSLLFWQKSKKKEPIKVKSPTFRFFLKNVSVQFEWSVIWKIVFQKKRPATSSTVSLWLKRRERAFSISDGVGGLIVYTNKTRTTRQRFYIRQIGSTFNDNNPWATFFQCPSQMVI